MTTDIETIGVAFDTSGLDKGTAAFERNAQAGAKTADTADKLTEKLKRQAETFNMSEAEVRRYDAAQVKATASQRAAIEQYLRAIEAQEELAQKMKITGDAGKSMFVELLKADAVVAGIKGIYNAISELHSRVLGGAAALDDFSERTGQSVEELSKMQQTAFISGQSFDMVVGAADRLSRGLSRADDETKGVGKALDYLGLSARNSDGSLKNSGALMKEVALKLSEYGDGAGKAAIAQALFGRGASVLLPYLKDLAEDGEHVANVTKEQAAMAEFYEKQQRRTQLAVENYVRVLSLELLPYVIKTKQAFFDGAKELFGWGDGADSASKAADGLIRAFRYVAIGAAVTAESIIGVVKLVRTLAGSFESVWADVKMAAQNANPLDMASNVATGRFKQQLEERNQAAAEANKRYVDLWNYNGTAISTAVRKAFDAADVEREAKRLEDAFGGGFGNGVQLAGKKVADFTDQADKADKSAKALAKEMEAQAKLIAELSGLSGDFFKEWDRLNKMFESGKISLGYLTEAQAKLLAKQPAMKAAAKEEAEARKEADKAYAEATKSYEKFIDSLDKELDKTREQIDKQREHNAEIGMTKEAVANLTAAKLEDAAATKDRSAAEMEAADGDLRMAAALREQAAALRELAGLKRQGGAMQAAVDATKKQEAEFEKFVDGIDKTFHDGFTSMMEKGTDGWRSWTKSLVSSFKVTVADEIYKMFVRPIAVNLISNMVSGGAGSAAGSIAGSAAGSAGGSVLGSAASSMFGGVSSAFTAGYAGLATTGAGAGLASSGATLIGSTGLMASEGGGLMAGISAGLGAIPAVGWIGLAAMALYSIFGSSGGGPKTEGGYAPGGMDISGLDIGGSLQGSQRGDVSSAQQISSTISQTLKDAAKAFGVAIDTAVGIFYAKDPEGTSQTQLQVVTKDYNRSTAMGGIENVGREDGALEKAVAESTADALLLALQKSVTGKAGDFLKGFDAAMVDAAQTNAIVQAAATATALWKVFDGMGPTMSALSDMSVEATNAFAEMAGGVDALVGQLSSYYSNYFSEEEKRLQLATSIQKTLAGAGLNLSIDQITGATRAQFRELTDAFIAMGSEGSKQAAALLAVNGAFAQLTPTSDALASSLKQLNDVTSGLQVDMLKAAGMTAAAERLQRALDTKNMTAAERAIYDYNAALRKQVSALQAAAAIASQRFSMESQLLQLQGNTAALRERELAAMDASLRPLQQVIYATEDLQTAQSNLDAARQSRIASYNNEASALQNTVQQSEAFIKSIKDLQKSLLLSEQSPLTPAQRYDEALSQFNAARSSGDASQIQSATQAFLQASEDMFGRSDRYTQDFNMVQQALTAAAATQSTALTAAKAQLAAVERSAKSLESISSNTASMAAALAAYNAAVLALAGAQANLDATNSGTIGPGGTGTSTGGTVGGGIVLSDTQFLQLVNGFLDAGDNKGAYDFTKSAGRTLAQLDALEQWPADTAENWALSQGYPVFHGGKSFVERTGPAVVERGERIFSAPDNQTLMRQLANRDEAARVMAEGIRALQEEIRLLREESRRGSAGVIGATAQAAATIAGSVKDARASTAEAAVARARAGIR